MPDYRKLLDKKYVGAWDLEGRDVTLTITRVEAAKIKSQRGEEQKPVIWFKGTAKALIANVTNCKTIAAMYGNKTEDWIGKRITLYATTTNAEGGKEVECVRIRPGIPRGKDSPPPQEPTPPVIDPDEPGDTAGEEVPDAAE